MNYKILVTGGAGYIGSHVCLQLLYFGFDVYIIDSLINSSNQNLKNILSIYKKNKELINNNLYFFKGDIRDQVFLESIFKEVYSLNNYFHAVIHLAGLKSVRESILKPKRYWDVNLNGSINLVNVMKKFNCYSIVFSSSATVYGIADKELLDENSIIKPCNVYGETKARIEKLLLNLCLENNNWRVCNLRYFNPAGAHYSGLIGEATCNNPNNLFPYLNLVAIGKKKFLRIYGNDWNTRDGTAIRDYLHVDDLAYGHLLIMQHILSDKFKIKNINIGTGKGTTVLELINTYQKVNNCEIPFEFVSRREGDVESLIADNQLLKKTLNWIPSKSLESMCLDSLNWQKNS